MVTNAATSPSEVRLGTVSCQGLLENLFDAVYFATPQRSITFWNPAAESLTGYRREHVVGKSCCEDLLVHLQSDPKGACSGWYPAAQTLQDGQVRSADVFFRHRQGHLLPVHIRVVPVYDANGQMAGVVEILKDEQSSAGNYGEASTGALAFIDPVSKLASRQYLELRLRSRFEEMKRYGWTFGVISASIDGFAEARAKWGPEIHQQLVSMVGKTFANCLRTFDVVGRWEEHQFLAIVPILQYSDLQLICERIRGVVAKAMLLVNGQPASLTVSIGAAGANPKDSVDKILERAKLWMNRSARKGGDQVTI